MKIKNIIFDLGGVLLDIDYNRTVQAFHRLGLTDAKAQFTKERQTEIFQTYERGGMTDQAFLAALGAYMPSVHAGEIAHAWCALLGSMPLGRMELLEKLAQRYDLFVLSNTNSIHQVEFEKTIDQKIGWERFSRAFKHIGYSHQLHLRKPDAEVFEKMLELNGLQAEETFFIDDTEEHVLSARSLGIQAFHLRDDEDIRDVFREW
jgi:putative hydrolase of the HAD superfamily